MMSSSLQESEEDVLSLESLKEASASLDLRESESCSLLLPCGLLPEELAELEEATGATQVGAGRMGRLGDGVADRRLTHRLGVCLTASCCNPRAG